MERNDYDEELQLLSRLFPSVAMQLRGLLSSLHLAAAALIPASTREADPDLDAKAARLDQSYYQILRLVNSLTAAARIENNKRLTLQNCDLVELARQFCAETEALSQLLGLTLTFRCELHQLICAVDAEDIRQLLFQLLSNALKFTPAGGTVTVELRRVEDMVLLDVADTGCGMDDLQLCTLFDRYRHRNLMEPYPHGLGLGVALCHRIAADHGGTLLVESRLGEGTRFTLRLPCRQVDRAPLSDVPFDYSGGFNRVLLGLADALPPEAFLIRNR